jgi:hypothetical protein
MTTLREYGSPRRGKHNVFWLLFGPAFLTSALSLRGANTVPFDYSFYGKTLQSYVDDRGLVDYRKLKSAGVELRAFVQQLAKVSPENHPEIFPTREAQLAYWVNAYNAFALKGVVDSYPTRSVHSSKTMYGFLFFRRLKFEVGGRKYTLNHIENEIIRKQYQDPRVHFALVSASMGCPRLSREPFLPDHLQEQLDVATRVFIGENRNVRVDPAAGKIFLSKIFAPSWYEGDFLYWYSGRFPGSKPGILDYLKLYLSADRKRLLETNPLLKQEYIEYDWSLNDQTLHPASSVG